MTLPTFPNTPIPWNDGITNQPTPAFLAYMLAVNTDVSTNSTAIGVLSSRKIGSFSRSLATASGSQVITGVGFLPRTVFFLGTVVGAAQAITIGFATASNSSCIAMFTDSATWISSSIACIFVIDSTFANQNFATITSFNADGFTLGWTKSGVFGTAVNVDYLALG